MGRTYPLIRAAGSPRDLGRQHGEQAAAFIRAFLDYLAKSLQLSRNALRTRALAFRDRFAAACPHLLEEIDGLAEGAQIRPAEALAIQIRGELSQTVDGACTTFVIGRTGTQSGEILIGQTSDMAAEIEEFAYVLHLIPAPQTPFERPPVLMWTFGGMIGYHGLNARGVAQFANSLGGGPAWRFALPHYPVKRLMLECRSIEEILSKLVKHPVCSSGNYVLCDGDGAILDIELTADGPNAIRDGGTGFLAHSNHFLCEPHSCRENFDRSLPDSFPRLERMRELIRAKFGRITVDDMQSALADHAGFPTSICRHPHRGAGDLIFPNPGRTVAAIISEPATGCLHVSRGNPCESPFVAYSLS